MARRIIKVRIFRFNPPVDEEGYYETYEVPLEPKMSVLNVLDYIYENLDSTLAYYSHSACCRGICGRCILTINGKNSLACQTEVSGDITVEPLRGFEVIKDLVVRR